MGTHKITLETMPGAGWSLSDGSYVPAAEAPKFGHDYLVAEAQRINALAAEVAARKEAERAASVAAAGLALAQTTEM